MTYFLIFWIKCVTLPPLVLNQTTQDCDGPTGEWQKIQNNVLLPIWRGRVSCTRGGAPMKPIKICPVTG